MHVYQQCIYAYQQCIPVNQQSISVYQQGSSRAVSQISLACPTVYVHMYIRGEFIQISNIFMYISNAIECSVSNLTCLRPAIVIYIYLSIYMYISK